MVEGCYIPFDFEKDFEREYLDSIKVFCLVMSEDYIRDHFYDIKKYASVIESRVDDEWCTIETLLDDNAAVSMLAKKHKLNCILIDNKYEIDVEL